MSIIGRIRCHHLVVLAIPLVLGVSCDPELSDEEKQQIQDKVQQDANTWIDNWVDQLGNNVPGADCEGAILCHGPAPQNASMECQECNTICEGSGGKPPAAWTGGAGCERVHKSKNFLFKVSFTSLGEIGAATASVQTSAALWTTNVEKATIEDPEEEPTDEGEDPAEVVTWRASFAWDMSFSQQISVTYTGGSVDVEIAFENAGGGFARCDYGEAGETCGGGTTSGTTGGTSSDDGGTTGTSTSTGTDTGTSTDTSTSTGYDLGGPYDGGPGDDGSIDDVPYNEPYPEVDQY